MPGITPRERFCRTLLFEHPDRVPFDPAGPPPGGVRESTLAAWQRQELSAQSDWFGALVQQIKMRR